MGNPTSETPYILVVDDEPEMCWVFKTMLEQQGYAVKTATSAGEAFAWSSSHEFRVALLDAKLPDIDGLELARQIRRSCPGVFVIMISGFYYNDDSQIDIALKTGIINAFFSKPFENSRILDLIKNHLGEIAR